MPTFHSPSSCAHCGSRKKLNPNTPDRDGKAISARNATSHGLFARDVVLPHLGEDADAYNALLDELLAQIAPKNLLERHYVEKIAAGTWRLRRLHRWQAQLFEDPSLDEGERLDRLDKVLRHETTLHRQIDAAVKMLGKDVAQLFATRAHAQALDAWGVTPQECKDTPAVAKQVEHQTRQNLDFPPFPADNFDLTTLDTKVMPSGAYTARPAPTPEQAETGDNKNCQNENNSENCQNETSRNAPEPTGTPHTENCQNEPENIENCQNGPHPAKPGRSDPPEAPQTPGSQALPPDDSSVYAHSLCKN